MLRVIQHPYAIPMSIMRRRARDRSAGVPLDYGPGVAELLARASAMDATFGVHAAKVAALSVRVARELGLGRDEVELLGLAAAVHDVGKLEVAAAIIAKPTALDPEEWDAMRRHPAVGADLLQECDVPSEVAAIVRSHHERWDGAGYPDGLSGDDIPFGARIVAVADAYCAMLEERPYRPPLEPREARAELQAQAGRQFDPVCAEATCRVVAAAG
jgi:putative nucleotidyltransferase with HDIG domain